MFLCPEEIEGVYLVYTHLYMYIHIRFGRRMGLGPRPLVENKLHQRFYGVSWSAYSND